MLEWGGITILGARSGDEQLFPRGHLEIDVLTVLVAKESHPIAHIPIGDEVGGRGQRMVVVPSSRYG